MALRHWLDSNGNWNTAVDWTGGVVPGPTDEAVIDAAGSYTVSENASPPISVASIEIAARAVVDITDVAGNQVGAGGVANSGTFGLHNNTTLKIIGGFTNFGTLDVDNNHTGSNGEGGGSLTIAGTLANSGVAQIGNAFLSAATTLALGGLTNAAGASFTLDGSASHAATLTVTGPAANSGTIDIGNFSILGVTGGKAFTQTAGTTTVHGALIAATIAIDGGTLAIDTPSFTNTGSLIAADGGKIDFGAGGLTNLSGTTLTGGIYVVDGGSTLQLPDNATVATLAANLTLSGAGSLVQSLDTKTKTEVAIESTLTTIAAGGVLKVAGNRSYATTKAIGDSGSLTVGGGTFTAASLSVAAGGTLVVDTGATLSLGSPLKVTGTATNAGTINGGGAAAVTMASGADRLILYPGAVFGGTVTGGGANAVLELAKGSGSGILNALGTKFTKFGTVTVDSGATWTVDALVSALSGVTIIGSGGSNALTLTNSGTVTFVGVSGFPTINLAAGNNTVTVADKTLSGGSVTIKDAASGNNILSAGDTKASTGKTLIYVAVAGADSFTGGFENDVVKVGAATVGKDTLTGGNGANTLTLTTAGTFSLSGVGKFGTIDLAAGNNTVTVADKTLSGGSVTIKDAASGNNILSAGDTKASTGKTLIYVAVAGADSFTGGFENDVVKVGAAAVGKDTLTGGNGANTLTLTTAGTFSLSGVGKFGTIDLAAGNNTVTVADKTLSGGSVTIKDAASGNNILSAGDTKASTGKTLIYVAVAGADSFTGGFENDVVKVGAAAVGKDTLTGGNGANTLTLTTAGTFSLSGVGKFGTIDLAAGNNTVTVADKTLSGGSVTIKDAASGNNILSAGDTKASTGKTLIYVAVAGADSFTGGFENDVVKVGAAAVGKDTLTGGNGANMLTPTAGTFSLSGVAKFGTINLAAGNNTVTVADKTLSGGSVTIKDAASGNNILSAGDTKASTGKTLIYVAGAGADSFTGGFENDVVKVGAAAVGKDTLTGGNGADTLTLTTAGTFSLSGVAKFGTINLAAGSNTVTLADKTLSGGSVTIKDAASGNNILSAGDTKASNGKTLTYLAGAGTDSFTGGFENDVVKVGAAAVGKDTLTGGSGADTLTLTTAGTFSLSGVAKFGTIDLAAGNNTVTVADKTLSGGPVTIKDGASGNTSISAAGDTVASTGKTLTYLAGAGTDSFTGGLENDAVKVGAAGVGGDILTGGSGANTLTLTTAGTFSLSGVAKFGTIDLAAGSNTVTVVDKTLSGGPVTIKDGASGNTSISAAGDTVASAGKTLTFAAGAGADSFSGGFENDVVQVSAAAVGGDTLTGGLVSNKLTLTTAGTFSLSQVSKFGTINLAAGNNTVTVADKTLSGGSVTIKDGAFLDGTGGDNSISAAGDTASLLKTLTYVAGSGTDSFTGGFENDVVKVSAQAVGGDTLTGGRYAPATLDLTTADTFSLSGVNTFSTINLAAGNNIVTVADKTLSGGPVTIKDGASGNNSISAADDTKVSTGKALTYLAGAGTDSFTGGFENDVVEVSAAAVGGDTLKGGSGANTLDLTTAGTVAAGGVSAIETYVLANGAKNTLTLTNANFTGVAGATITITDGNNGNTVNASALTGANRIIVHAGTGADVLTGGGGNDVFYAGGDTTMTGAGGANEFVFSAAGKNTITDFAPSTGTTAAGVPALTTLVTFNGTTNEENPYGGLIVDAAGNLFGTTEGVGEIVNEAGTVFEIAKTGGNYASTPNTLVSFNITNGASPTGGLIADAAGDLFGTAFDGGANNGGTVFEIAKTGGSYASTPTTLVNFNGTNGQFPEDGLIADTAGNLFGTTSSGGANGDGTVFEIAKTGGSYASTPTTLVSFNSTNGADPVGGLITDAAGDLFGATEIGGANKDGTVFEIVKTGGSYASTPTTLASFDGTNGLDPYAGVIADAAGDLFGTTEGGLSADGTVFELVNNGSGSYKLTTLVSFNGTDGRNPTGGLIVDGAGNLFGMTDFGGANKDGTAFEIPFIDGSYASTPTTLVNFNGTNGQFPEDGLTADTAGHLFGTTSSGGGAYGTAFELTGSGFVVAPTTTNEIVFSNSGFALGLSGATATPKPLPGGLFVSDSTGAFTAATQRFAYGTSNGELFYSASGTTATEHLVTALTGAPLLTASHLFFIT